jgi:hypothetical protein
MFFAVSAAAKQHNLFPGKSVVTNYLRRFFSASAKSILNACPYLYIIFIERVRSFKI